MTGVLKCSCRGFDRDKSHFSGETVVVKTVVVCHVVTVTEIVRL